MSISELERHPVEAGLVEDKLLDVDVLNLDYDQKTKLLQQVTTRLLQMRVEYSRVSGRAAELQAELTVLREVKSALQSAIKAEGL